MLKLFLGLIVLIVPFVIYFTNKKWSQSLEGKKEELADEAVKSKVLGVREKVVHIRGQNVAKEEKIIIKERKL